MTRSSAWSDTVIWTAMYLGGAAAVFAFAVFVPPDVLRDDFAPILVFGSIVLIGYLAGYLGAMRTVTGRWSLRDFVRGPGSQRLKGRQVVVWFLVFFPCAMVGAFLPDDAFGPLAQLWLYLTGATVGQIVGRMVPPGPAKHPPVERIETRSRSGLELDDAGRPSTL